MPPKKRSGSTSNAAPAQSKKSKPDDLPDVEHAGILHESKRWVAVSGSRNLDAEYKHYLKNEDGTEKPYEYICMCRAPWNAGDSDDEEDEEDEDDDDDEEEDETEKTKKPACDGGKTCLCRKPAAEHPDHPWIITNAGFLKFHAQRTMMDLRDPDMWAMYIYNDFHAYGVLEVFENLLLDWLEAEGNWKEQWVVCQTIVWFLLDHASAPMTMIDDGSKLDATVQLAARVFLSMLASLESKKLLSDTSEVKDLGLVMALYMQMAKQYRTDFSLLEGDDQICHFDNYILTYANKFGIPLVGPADIDDIAAGCDGTVKLPAVTAAKPDPWGSAAAIKKHEKEHGTSAGKGKKASIGGDKHDITAFSSAERKAQSFDKKDILGKEGIEALKKGLVLRPA
ncbi:hypothetical protein CONLIGDRAFT_469830 [Coniochaeta ligniaria NRRL 30616]|uniref:Uncharacterized protein n=1 Tax=Coniochaeta ligniaria NRRL 30616 TaxID=1408157 RepID=A0A1J7JFG9_9PEZI|nr:hypothetical protein CONLIGDRAFT_469830 [Coniochaeta ligniaria NRRL 30616]